MSAATSPSATSSKAPRRRAPRRKKVGPTVSELIVTAVSASNERSGVSAAALKKALAAGGYDVEKNKTRLKTAIKSLVAKRTLVQSKGTGVSGSFKINKNKAKPKARKQVRRAAPKRKKRASKKRRAAKRPKSSATKKRAGARKSRKRGARKAAKRPKRATKSPKRATKSPKRGRSPAAKKPPQRRPSNPE